MLTERIERAKAEAQKQIDSGLIQGAVFTATGFPVTAIGKQCVNPKDVPMTVNSRFDMASVGKTMTAADCALLILDGKLEPDTPFVKYFPEFPIKDCDITVRELAMHVSGFSEPGPAYSAQSIEESMQILLSVKPVRKRMEAYEYASCNFVFLGKIINNLTGKDLDTFTRERIWKTLGMNHTTWYALGDGPDEVEHWFPNRPAGQHNDPITFLSKEPLGNGSFFSTAEDMMKFVQDLLERKTFPKEYYDLLFTLGFEKNGKRRSFGWDMSDEDRPEGFSDKTILHTGWSGQTICVDPENGFAAVVLTSRTGDHKEARVGRSKIISIMCGTEK